MHILLMALLMSVSAHAEQSQSISSVCEKEDCYNCCMAKNNQERKEVPQPGSGGPDQRAKTTPDEAGVAK